MECCVVFLGVKQLNFEDMYFTHLKVLREYNFFSPRAKPSTGLSFWHLNCRRMVYRLLLKILWGNDCEWCESFTKYVKNAIIRRHLDIHFSMRHMFWPSHNVKVQNCRFQAKKGLNVDFPLSRDGNGDHMCRKRVKDSRNKLTTVGDVHRTLCEQKETSALCATNCDRNTSKQLLGSSFYSKKV